MWPSMSAYTKFCDGVTKSRSAVVNSLQLRASFSSRNDATVVSDSSSAVQRNASGSSGSGRAPGPFGFGLLALIASDTSGPWRVTRTVICTGPAPLTAIVSDTSVTGSSAPRNSACFPVSSRRSR